VRGVFDIPSPTDTMGRAGSPRKEKARRERFDHTGHASPGPDVYREKPVAMPVCVRRDHRH
jgi:hypothetical protein